MNEKTECEKYKKKCEKKLKKEMITFKIIGAIIFFLLFFPFAISHILFSKFVEQSLYAGSETKSFGDSFFPLISVIFLIYLGIYLFYFRKIKKSFIFIFIIIAILLFIIPNRLRYIFSSGFFSDIRQEGSIHQYSLFGVKTKDVKYGYLYFGYYAFLLLFGFIGSLSIPSKIKIK